MAGAALHTLNDVEHLLKPVTSPHLVLLKSNERPDAAANYSSEAFESILMHLQAEVEFLREQLREQERQHVLKDALLENARIREQALRADLYC